MKKMVQKKHKEVSTCPHITIMVAVGLLFCLSVPAEALEPTKSPPDPSIPNFKLVDDPALGITGDPRIGRVKVQTKVNGPYDDICATSLMKHFSFNDIAATAACRTLGFNDIKHAGLIRRLKLWTTYNYTMYNVTCPDDNSGLKDCTYNLDPENKDWKWCLSPLFLDCHERHPEMWKLRIQPDTQGNTPSIGLLEMQPDTHSDWGTVCSNMFNNYSALMMCKAAGFTDITSARAILNYSSDKPSTGSKRTTYLTDVVCDENSTSLKDCTYAYNSRGIRQSSVCNDMTDVGIDCSGAPTPKGSSALPIVLGVLGAVVLVGLAVGGIIMYRRRNRSSNVNDDSDRVDYVGMDECLNDE